jgi:hypothetical protein
MPDEAGAIRAMFDVPDSLRATASRYRYAASGAQDPNVSRFFQIQADRCDLKAAALESQQESGTIVVAWDMFHRLPANVAAGSDATR